MAFEKQNIQAIFQGWDGEEHKFNKIFGKEKKLCRVRTAECIYMDNHIFISIYDDEIDKLNKSLGKGMVRVNVVDGIKKEYLNPSGEYAEPKIQYSAGKYGYTEVEKL